MSLRPRRQEAAHERRSTQPRSWRSCVTSATSRGSRNIRHGDSNRATHRLSSLGAKVVVAAHPTDSIVTEDAMTIAIMLSVAGLGFLLWLAFNLAVYALPFFAAVAGGLFAYHTGAGPIGGAAIPMAAGGGEVASCPM